MERVRTSAVSRVAESESEAGDMRKDELRPLADYELFLVGGGDDTPGWSPPH